MLSTPFYRGIPLATAHRALLADRAVERLIAVLGSWEQHTEWENAVLLLGLSGDERAFQALTSFLRRDDSPAARTLRCQARDCSKEASALASSTVVSREVYFAKSNVPIALGLYLYTSARRRPTMRADLNGPQVVEFLKACSQPKSTFWGNQVQWQAENYTGASPSYMYADLSAQCIEGFGLSGTEAATTYLTWLHKHVTDVQKKTDNGKRQDELREHGYPVDVVNASFFTSFLESIASASQANAIIARDGLANYYARRQ
ncbi:MAG TPA: hypothetical protein VEU96_28780 [Bryobacteraceae bacterium]|nr:hypothetical protein [Bryobacteraceae bacterium]